jgi:hypothetical protein
LLSWRGRRERERQQCRWKGLALKTQPRENELTPFGGIIWWGTVFLSASKQLCEMSCQSNICGINQWPFCCSQKAIQIIKNLWIKCNPWVLAWWLMSVIPAIWEAEIGGSGLRPSQAKS